MSWSLRKQVVLVVLAAQVLIAACGASGGSDVTADGDAVSSTETLRSSDLPPVAMVEGWSVVAEPGSEAGTTCLEVHSALPVARRRRTLPELPELPEQFANLPMVSCGPTPSTENPSADPVLVAIAEAPDATDGGVVIGMVAPGIESVDVDPHLPRPLTPGQSGVFIAVVEPRSVGVDAVLLTRSDGSAFRCPLEPAGLDGLPFELLVAGCVVER